MTETKEAPSLTFAHNPRILDVATVMRPPPIVVTQIDACLQPRAMDVVQPYPATPLSELCPCGDARGRRVAELVTDHIGVVAVPLVVADGPPRPIKLDFHAPLRRGPAPSQADGVHRSNKV